MTWWPSCVSFESSIEDTSQLEIWMRNAVLTMALVPLHHLLAADVAPLTRPPGAEASPQTTVLNGIEYIMSNPHGPAAAPRPRQPGNPPC